MDADDEVEEVREALKMIVVTPLDAWANRSLSRVLSVTSHPFDTVRD